MAAFVSHNFLEDLALVLCVAAAVAVLCQILRQPVVVGYLIAGLIVGPYTPGVFADPERIHHLSELGVILLMFALGLEFDLRKLVRLGPASALITAFQVGFMLWLGYVCGRALGWTTLESVFTGALVSISSTTIVAKAFGEDSRIDHGVRELAMGVLLMEDLTAVVELAVLTALASGAAVSASMVVGTVGRLAAFLLAMVAGGILLVPPAMRLIVRLDRPETVLVASIGICFAFAMIAERSGYSVALGAFLAGVLVAESGEVRRTEHLVAPVRDIFGAVFFVSVGMMIDPGLIAKHWPALLWLVAAVIAGKTIGVSLGAILAGSGLRTSIQTGMSLAQIGEFSFIIAGVGLELKATREFIYTLAVAVSAITTFTTPFMIQTAVPVAEAVGRWLPEPVGSFSAIYDSWMERMRTATRATPRTIGGPAALTVASAAALAAILILNELDPYDFTTKVAAAAGLNYFRAGLLVDLMALVVCAAPATGIFFGSRALARAFAARTVRAAAVAEEAVEALVEMLQVTIMLAVVVPTLAIVQPWLEPVEGIGALIIGGILMIIAVWRMAVRVRGRVGDAVALIASEVAGARRVMEAEIPGLGALTPVKISAGSAAIGATLRELNLRSRTGATVVAIARAADGVVVPTGDERLHEDDVVELIGTHDAIEAAARLLAPPRAPTFQPA